MSRARDLARTELDVDGQAVPVWAPKDDELPERLHVTVVWTPALVINGHEVSAFGMGPEPLPLVTASARVARRAVARNRTQALDDELDEVAESLASSVEAQAEMTRAYLSAILRLCLARRGFPVP